MQEATEDVTVHMMAEQNRWGKKILQMIKNDRRKTYRGRRDAGDKIMTKSTILIL